MAKKRVAEETAPATKHARLTSPIPTPSSSSSQTDPHHIDTSETGNQYSTCDCNHAHANDINHPSSSDVPIEIRCESTADGRVSVSTIVRTRSPVDILNVALDHLKQLAQTQQPAECDQKPDHNVNDIDDSEEDESTEMDEEDERMVVQVLFESALELFKQTDEYTFEHGYCLIVFGWFLRVASIIQDGCTKLNQLQTETGTEDPVDLARVLGTLYQVQLLDSEEGQYQPLIEALPSKLNPSKHHSYTTDIYYDLFTTVQTILDDSDMNEDTKKALIQPLHTLFSSLLECYPDPCTELVVLASSLSISYAEMFSYPLSRTILTHLDHFISTDSVLKSRYFTKGNVLVLKAQWFMTRAALDTDEDGITAEEKEQRVLMDFETSMNVFEEARTWFLENGMEEEVARVDSLLNTIDL